MKCIAQKWYEKNNIDFIYMKSKNVTNGINLLTSTLFSLIIGGDAFGFRLNLIVKKKQTATIKVH